MKKALRPRRRSSPPDVRLDRRKDDEEVADHVVRGVRANFVRDVVNDSPSKKSPKK